MITASVVLYKTSMNDLRNLIVSFAPSNDRLLFIIDNSPNELTAEKIDSLGVNIEYIFNNSNIGYGVAHNIGLKKAVKLQSDFHIILNPDLIFEPCIVDKLNEYALKHDDVIYILPKVLSLDGSIQHLCKLLPNPLHLFMRRFLNKSNLFRIINEKYILFKSGYDKIINPPCLSGCFMFIRVKPIIDNHLFFDDRFFMYFEDFDLIRRLHRIGKTIFYPDVSIIHKHEQASYKSFKMLSIHLSSAIKYFNKWGWIYDKERKAMNKKILKEIGYI